VTIALAASFSGYDFGRNSQIVLNTTGTSVTIEGNQAVIDGVQSKPGQSGRFFLVDQGVQLEVSNVTFKNGIQGNGGAISVSGNATVSLSSCTFSYNGAHWYEGNGGAISVSGSATVSLTSCTFSGNGVAEDYQNGNGGAISVLISRILCKFRRTSRNRRYAPAGHLLRGVWPGIMYNDHAL
jgi:hypothetical protein